MRIAERERRWWSENSTGADARSREYDERQTRRRDGHGVERDPLDLARQAAARIASHHMPWIEADTLDAEELRVIAAGHPFHPQSAKILMALDGT